MKLWLYSNNVWKTLLLFYFKAFKRLSTPSKIINFSFNKYTNRTFLIQPDKNLELRFKDLEDRVERMLSFLKERGLNKGEVLAFISGNCPEYFQMRAACYYLGVIFFGLPLNLDFEDIVYFLNKSNTKILFYREYRHFDINGIKNKTRVNYFINLDSPSYSQILQKSSSACRRVSNNSYELATLNLSSGTTQRTPKIIQLTKENWTESLYGYLRNSDVQPNKKIVFLCTLSFLTAGSTTFLPSILAGVTNIIIKEDFSLESLVDYINRYRVNRLYITPSWFLELFEWCRENREDLSSLENIILGTERMPSLRLKEAIEFFGPKITVGYGMVEVLPPITMLSGKDYYFKGRLKGDLLGSAGKIIKGIKIKILDDSFNELPPGKIGKIAIKSKTVGKGYLDDIEDNLKCFKDGWFYTDDYGFVAKEEFLYILGRKDEIIAYNKERAIFAKELEDHLYKIPFIKRCAAIAKDNQIFVFVSLRGDLDENEAKVEIIEFCRKNLEDFLVPKEVFIKENLPINSLGKLDRRRLSEEIA